MKKFAVLLVMLSLTVCVFAQNYIVQSVSGRVQQEIRGSRVDVKVGDTLSAETVIHTGASASLILKDGNKTLSVPAARSGKLSDLTAVASGVRAGGSVARVDTSTISRTTSQVSTASARASDSAKDEDIAEE